MEINKERVAFEAEFSKIKSDIAFWLHTWDEEMQGYNHPVMCWFWHMWQAKSQATPEGFVLVKKELPEKVDFKLTDYFSDISEGENYDAFVKLTEIDNKAIYKAIIEAQEQSHD